MKKYTLDELTDQNIIEKGSMEREQFEFELKLGMLGDIDLFNLPAYIPRGF
ncbi:MAG: hypothetical protein M0Q90_05680 [Bacteroidales bacterium]|nr:hypothetical protein [Bacteroidales bacterium]